MTNSLTLALTASLWTVHLALLLSIAHLGRGKPVELKVATVLFLFYSLAPLFSFEFDFFEYRVRYVPEPLALLVYIMSDVLFLAASLYLYGARRVPAPAAGPRDDLRAGGMALVVLAMGAQLINVFFNWEYLLLPKNEYIAEIGQNVTPNLLLFTIPADSILVGALLVNPFRSRPLRWAVIVLGLATLLLSVFQGYRHLILLLLLVAYLMRYSKGGGIMLIAVTLALTFAGELSNMLKMWFYQALLDPEFDHGGYLQWYFSTVEWLPVSTEQAAAAANFHLGLSVMQLGSDFVQFLRLIPFTSSLVENLPTSVDQIGKLVGVDYGQGTAYNFQLFMLNTFLLGGAFLFLVLLLLRATRNTVLLIYGLEIFSSLLRNSPSFWLAQIKLMVVLLLILHAASAGAKLISHLRRSSSRQVDRTAPAGA